MMRRIAFVRVIILLSVCVCVCRGAGAEKNNAKNIYEYIAEIHLPTMAHEESQEILKNAEIDRHNEDVQKSNFFKVGDVAQLPELGDVEKLRQAYLILGSQKQATKSFFLRLDATTLDDLEILSGQKSKLQRHLIALFDPYFHSAIGKVQLQKMLCQPLTNIDELQKRQDKIRKLFVDTSKLEGLNKKLNRLRKAENEFLWFWKSMSTSAFDQLETLAVPKLIPLPGSMMHEVEKNPLATEAMSRTALGLQLLGNPISWAAIAFGIIISQIGWDASVRLFQLMADGSGEFVRQNPGVASYVFILTAFATYGNVKSFADYNAATNVFHAKMNSVATFIKTAEELLGDEFVRKNKEDVATLVSLLKTSTFKSAPSFFAYKGRAVAAFTLMNELKNNFVTMLDKVGQVDAEVAVASFMQAQAKNKNGVYCFPNYVEKEAPYINLGEYWHPFLNHETVITNDLELGQTASRNIIVTGPNAGGKSTALKSISLAIIMAQTLGIAPARSLTFTPFKIISTYMNVADDAGSESLFQAEMHRAANLVKLVKNQTGKDFIFVVMDELFTGTNPLEGTSAAYGVIKKLITYPNSMLIFVTHFKELTELEQETNGQIKNFKVWVDRQNGSISYPYKMVPGISDQTIALELLALEGFDPEILSQSVAQLDRMKHARHSQVCF